MSHQNTSTSMAITFVYFSDYRSHSRSLNHRCDGESWRSQREILGMWKQQVASLHCAATRIGFHCWAMVGGLLDLEIERTVLRKKGVSSVAAPTCCGQVQNAFRDERRAAILSHVTFNINSVLPRLPLALHDNGSFHPNEGVTLT